MDYGKRGPRAAADREGKRWIKEGSEGSCGLQKAGASPATSEANRRPINVAAGLAPAFTFKTSCLYIQSPFSPHWKVLDHQRFAGYSSFSTTARNNLFGEQHKSGKRAHYNAATENTKYKTNTTSISY